MNLHMNTRELERLVGAVILPSVRPVGGLAPGAPERRPSRVYLERFPPCGLIGFGRRLPDGATIDGLREMLAAVRRDGIEPVFVAADLEQGAGYHLPGCTLLPPARALAEAEAVRPGSLFEAGRLTALEARAHGIELVLTPVLDVNSNPANPIIGARAFGTTPEAVATAAAAFLAGLASAGAGASLKHFPGHGDTAVDSHLALPRIDSDLAALEALELAPFGAVLQSPAARALGPRLTVMAAHLDVPALTGEPGLATSLSVRALARLGAMGFTGAVLTDGLEMLAVADAPELGVRALEAGCHGLLAPADEGLLAVQLFDAVQAGRLDADRLARAAGRMRALAAGLLRGAPAPLGGTPGSLGLELAFVALRAQPSWRAFTHALSEPFELVGEPSLVGRLRARLPEGREYRGAPQLLLGSPGSTGADLSSASSLIWFGPPESLPPGAEALPHLWAWAPGGIPEEAILGVLRADPDTLQLPDFRA
jgi:beta-glucosidase-like glycosyl hydrolase